MDLWLRVDPTTNLSSLDDHELACLFNQMETALTLVTWEISDRMDRDVELDG